jgi:hypothetical protein
MERKTGFYWVIQDPDIGWEYAYWNGRFWWVVGNTYQFKDSNLIEINEIKLEYNHPQQ